MFDDRHVRVEAFVEEDLIKLHRETTLSMQSVTAMGDSAHGNVDETHFGNQKLQVRFDEADVGFIIWSVGKTSQ